MVSKALRWSTVGLSVAGTGRGVGIRVLAKAVVGYRRAGVGRIETFAARSAGQNGYYTWPRPGFELELSEDCRDEAILNGFVEVETTHYLFLKYEDEKAAEFWYDHGHAGEAEFRLGDLASM